MTTSVKSIKDLFDLDYENHKTYEIQTEFQIIKIHSQETKNLTHGKLYTLTLADKEYSYSKFIYCKTASSPELEIGKFINIKKVCPMILEAHKEKAFLIKELEILPKCSDTLLQSISYNNNSFSQKISSQDSEFMSYNNNHDEDDITYGNSYTPLKQLTTLSSNFKLLVKIVSKGEIKSFKNNKGKLFSFVIMDDAGSKMAVVGFDKMVEKFKDFIEENQIYEISGGYLRMADKKYDPTGSDYKLILNETSVIEKKSTQEVSNFAKFSDPDSKLCSIPEIKESPVNTIINVLCAVADKGETTDKDTKNGPVLIRKTIITDESNEKMELTLWRHLTQLKINNGDILLIKKVRINDFGGKNITSTSDTKIYINPLISQFTFLSKEIENLKNFSDKNKLNQGIASQDSRNNTSNSGIANPSFSTNIKKEYNDKIVYIDSILEEMDKYIFTDFDHRFPFYKIKATVTHLGHSEKNFYPGCPNKECNRKIIFSNNDWICQYCRQSYKNPKYYYSLNIRVKDCSSEYWVDIFGKPAETLMGMTADEYRNVLINRDDERLGQISDNVEYKEFYFLLKVRLNKFNDSTKKKFTANKVERFVKKNDVNRMLTDIKLRLNKIRNNNI